MMILLGIQADDHEEDIEWLSSKICNLRILTMKTEYNESFYSGDSRGNFSSVSSLLMACTSKPPLVHRRS